MIRKILVVHRKLPEIHGFLDVADADPVVREKGAARPLRIQNANPSWSFLAMRSRIRSSFFGD
jgi:hypothetical protein